MKTSLLAALLGAMLTGAAVAAPDSNLAAFFQRLQNGEKQTVVAFGTSLTRDGAWVSLMEQWFNEKYPGLVTVINSGGRGQNSDWGAAQVQSQVLDHHPDLVFVEFSYNDAHQRFKLTPEHCQENLLKIIGEIQKQNPQTAIVLQTMNAPWNAPTGFVDSETNRPNIEAYNENYRIVAKEKSLPLVDNYPVWLKIKESDPSTYHTMVPDGSHPNRPASEKVTWADVKALLEAAQS